LITERSAFAQNQFTKEAGTAEGAAKIAGARMQDSAANLGKSFLPIYTKAAEIVGVLAKAFDALPDSVQVGILGLGAAIAVGPKIVDSFKAATDAVKSIPGALSKMTDKLTSSKGMLEGFGTTAEMSGKQAGNAAGAAGFGALAPAMLGIGAAIGIAAYFWMDYQKKQEAAKKRATELKDTLDQTTGAMTKQTEQLLYNNLEQKNQIDNLNEAGIGFDKYLEAIKDTSSGMEKLLELQKQGATGVTALKNEQYRNNTIKKLREEGGARNELVATLIEQEKYDLGLLGTIITESEAHKKNIAVLGQAAYAAELKTSGDKAQAQAASDAAIANAKNNEALKEQYDAVLALLNSDIAFQQAQIASQKAIEEYNKSLSDGSLSARDREEKEAQLKQQFLQTAAAAAKAAEDQRTLEGKTLSAKDAAIIQRDKLIELAGQVAPGSPVQAGLQQMIDKLQGIIDRRVLDIKIFLDKYQAIAAIDDVNVRIAAMKGLAYSPGSRDYSSLKERAVGGPVNAGTPYLVGERGPELFVPTGYGNIMDNVATMRSLTSGTNVGVGGGVNVTINLPPGSNGEDVVDAIRRYERRNGPIFQAA